MKPLSLHPSAKREFAAAVKYIKAKRAASAEGFAQKVRSSLESISRQPRVHAVIRKGVRKAIIRKFSYCIYYREDETRIRVIAIFHCKRDPAIWRGRI
jgi:toxin ParE1/3/4